MLLTNEFLNNEENIRANIQSIIQKGGTAEDLSGNETLDFTYILYGQSSEDSSQVSAYIYEGRYGVTNQPIETRFDNTKIKINSLAEIMNIENGSISMDNFSNINL